MKYGLIDQEDIDALPQDNYAAFVGFERICRQSLNEITATLHENDDWSDLRSRFVSKIAAAAVEYDVPGYEKLNRAYASTRQYTDFAAFDQGVTEIVTRLQIRSAKKRNAETFKLPPSRSAEIAKYIEILRRRIEASEFDLKKKDALFKKLAALKAELTGSPRADLAKTMVIIAGIMTTINQAEAAIIKLPDAIAAVMKVVGYASEDAEAEKAEQAAISAATAPRAIEDRRPKPLQSQIPTERFSADLDDEIPF